MERQADFKKAEIAAQQFAGDDVSFLSWGKALHGDDFVGYWNAPAKRIGDIQARNIIVICPKDGEPVAGEIDGYLCEASKAGRPIMKLSNCFMNF